MYNLPIATSIACEAMRRERRQPPRRIEKPHNPVSTILEFGDDRVMTAWSRRVSV